MAGNDSRRSHHGDEETRNSHESRMLLLFVENLIIDSVQAKTCGRTISPPANPSRKLSPIAE